MPSNVTGTLVDAATNPITAGTFVRFQLKGTLNIQPVVTGVGALCAGSGTGQGYFVDFTPNASGVISGSVYSTRDSTGLLAGEITVNGNGTACWWEVSIWRGNKKISSVHTHAKTGATLDIGNLIAISTTPVATAPTGDTTYARLDGSNTPFTGIVQFLQGILLALGKSVAWSTDLFLGRGAAGKLTVGTTAGASDGTVSAASYQVGGVSQSGTGPLVAQTNAALTTPNIGVASGTSLALGGGTALATTNRTGTGNLVLATAPTITNSTQDTINQPAATAFTLKDNQGGTRYSIPSGGAAQAQINNTNLTGASTANTILVLNAQGAVGPLTGNSADQVVYTFSIPANTIETNSKSINVRCSLTHTTGTVSTTIKINLNGVNIASLSSGTTASQSTALDVEILRTGTTTAGTSGIVAAATGNTGAFSIAATGLAWTSAQTLTVTFNVANTDTWTGNMFMVKQNQ